MIKIPNTFLDDEYIQVIPVNKVFKNLGIKAVERKHEISARITDYINKHPENETTIKHYLNKVIKEGHKDICYKFFYNISDQCHSRQSIENIIREKYGEISQNGLLNFYNTNDNQLVNYRITETDNVIKKVSFTYSRLLADAEKSTYSLVIYPVFVDIYFDEMFITARAKSKSKLYIPNDNNEYIEKVDSKNNLLSIINEVCDFLQLETGSRENARHKIHKIQYGLYNKYSSTPKEVLEEIKNSKNIWMKFINDIFAELSLPETDKEDAHKDIEIFL